MGRIYHTYAMLCLDFDLFHNANQQMYPAAKEAAEGLQTKVRMTSQLLKASKVMSYSPPLLTNLNPAWSLTPIPGEKKIWCRVTQIECPCSISTLLVLPACKT